jgi:adenylate cyclase
MSLMSTLIIDQTKKAFIKEMEIRTEFFARSVREALFPEIDPLRLYFHVQEMVKEKAIQYAIVIDNNGKILSHNKNEYIGKIDNSYITKNIIKSSEMLSQKYRDNNGRLLYDISRPIIIGGKRKVGAVRIGFTDTSLNAALSPMKTKVIVITILMLIIGILGTIIVVMYIVRPINILSETAKEIGKGNLNQKVTIKRHDEIGQLATTFNEMIEGLKERDFIRNTFGKYVSKQVADAVLKGELKLGGEKKRVTVLLSDIRNFTNMSERYPPEEVVKFLNEYFSEMVNVVIKYDGTVDKFIGDAIFSVFGAPLAYLDDAHRAIKVAVEMRDRLHEFNKKVRGFGFDEIKIGIAVHTGEVIAGNIGSEQRLEYTVIGDTVNTAARIEPLNKEWNTEILISENTYEIVRDNVNVRQMPRIKLRGKEKEIQLYELVSLK